jgi:LuxR family maltose regulon positive regulatory protein
VALLQRDLWLAVLDVAARGVEPAAASPAVEELVLAAAAEHQIALLRSPGRRALPLLRARYAAAPTVFLREVLRHREPAAPTGGVGADELVERLTDREVRVLSFLPTTMSNSDIAEQLGVSQNTLKSHLKHIYRKLGVAGRRAAVQAAERHQLL